MFAFLLCIQTYMSFRYFYVAETTKETIAEELQVLPSLSFSLEA